METRSGITKRFTDGRGRARMAAMDLTIRDARDADIPALLTIYNDAVLHTTAVWTEEPRALETQKQWFAEKRAADKPVLVAAENDVVVGFATYGPFRTWPGYRHTVENSIYVAPDRRGRGIGSKLLPPLIGRARSQQIHAIIAGIDAANNASVRLHTTHGFVKVGLLKEVGIKFGRWLDLAFYELVL